MPAEYALISLMSDYGDQSALNAQKAGITKEETISCYCLTNHTNCSGKINKLAFDTCKKENHVHI